MSEFAQGKEIVLRDRVPSDLEVHLQWLSGGEWLSYDAPWETREAPGTEEDLRQFRERFMATCEESESSPRKRGTIVTRDGKPIGWVNRYANPRFPKVCYVGIDICEDDHLNGGRGTEALRLWVDHLFAESDLHRIGIDTWSLNPRMCRVAEKLGFVFEGSDRELIEWNGEWLDRHRYGLLRKEWEEAQGIR